MWLVLCELNDASAIWAYQGLKSLGLEPIELLSAEMLAYSFQWEHRLGDNTPSIKIMLYDGRTISSDTISGVLNRLQTIPIGHLRANPADRDYASQELFAFFMSWIFSLPQQVLNRPTSQGLSGQWRHASEWVWLATQAGLTTLLYKQTSYDEIDANRLKGTLVPADTSSKMVIVIDGYVIGSNVPPDIAKSCKHLSELSETNLLGIEFIEGSAGSWTFAGATPLPDLRLGGQDLLNVLATVLRKKKEEKI